jgi:hypothetical protein
LSEASKAMQLSLGPGDVDRPRFKSSRGCLWPISSVSPPCLGGHSRFPNTLPAARSEPGNRLAFAGHMLILRGENLLWFLSQPQQLSLLSARVDIPCPALQIPPRLGIEK